MAGRCDNVYSVLIIRLERPHINRFGQSKSYAEPGKESCPGEDSSTFVVVDGLP